MSYGLDLYRADVVVWFGATDWAELYMQGNKRIDRPGQAVPTTILQLAATNIGREMTTLSARSSPHTVGYAEQAPSRFPSPHRAEGLKVAV
jgi:hypothetical protein